MYTFYAIIRNDAGGYFKATVQADNAYNATQMLKSMYGNMMLNEYASQVV